MRHSFILLAFAGITYAIDSIGCFSGLPTDAGEPIINLFQTPSLCSDQCEDSPYIALFGQQCYCLSEVPTEGRLNAAACNTTCGGYPTLTCGGENSFEVYVGTNVGIVIDDSSSGSSSFNSSSDSDFESDSNGDDSSESDASQETGTVSESALFGASSPIPDDLEFESLQIKGTTTELALVTDSASFDSDKTRTANLTLHLNVANSQSITSSILGSDSVSSASVRASESTQGISEHSESSKVRSDSDVSATDSSETQSPSPGNSTANATTTSSANDVGQININTMTIISGFAALCLSFIIA
ncbi:uncharacterized protein RJT20DRAFT_50892 [Scheffersomyces xylosifermentans]|uniref:uncharacterized protein n=1 Tax=Scheffersomyces xylosifermentans TaxID=1304137 RepID=UPI00315DC826